MKTPTTSLRLPVLLGLLMLMLSFGTRAQTKSDSIDTFLQLKMQQLRIPGLQLAVIQHGKLVKSAQYGLANVQDSIPVTNKTRFALNSITKAFVGVAIMQLVEAGKLELTSPLSKYLTGLPAAWQPVTVRHLLTHTSGLPDIMPEDVAGMVTEGNESAAWARLQTQPLDFATGEKFAYNQTNYVLLGKIIDQLSGQPFTQFIKTRQLDVVGMPRTTTGDAHDVLPHAARGYTFTRVVDGEFRRTNQLRHLFEVYAPSHRTAAGMSSTAEEMARWIIALQQGKLLQPGSLPTLWTPGVLNNGSRRGFSRFLNGYALGWPTVGRAEHPAVAPVGGGRSAVFVYPQDDLAIVVLTNLQGANPDGFMDELAGFYVPDMQVAKGFGLSPNLRALHNELSKHGFAQALAEVKKARKKNPAYQLPEDEVNAWGYSLLKQAQPKNALEIFKLNVSLYPRSANAYDSLAEAYEEMGNADLARKNYQRSLELDPKNANAAQHLKKG